MDKIRILYDKEGQYMMHQVFCPACRVFHGFKVAPDGPFGWDGNTEQPTLYPDLLTTPRPNRKCHFSVTAGEIYFFDDSDHFYRNQTLELPEI